MTTRTTHRAGYTLIELLVSMALIMTIMSILSMAFVSGLKTFGSLRATADMSQRLRVATGVLRSDLSNFHFDGAIRPSDPGFNSSVVPREGFFRIYEAAAPQVEGTDGINKSYLATNHALHLTVKRRGNRPEDFFVATLPGQLDNSLGASTTFFNQPGDARNQTSPTQYYCQWAEVLYYVWPIAGATTAPIGGAPQQLYGLYRAQRLLVANNTNLGPAGAGFSTVMSVNPNTGNFNTPADVTNINLPNGVTTNRGLSSATPPSPPTIDTLLVGNVISFTVRPIMVPPNAVGNNTPQTSMPIAQGTNYDSATATPNTLLFGVEITIRLWDLKSQQTRQITIIQDL
jgi:type II secretory pathway pseudopilin PulG